MTHKSASPVLFCASSTMRRLAVALLALAVVGAGVGQGHADTIPTLYDTGVDDTGTPLPDLTIGDPHYSLVSAPNGSSTTLVILDSTNDYPLQYYTGTPIPDGVSTWIAPDNDQNYSPASPPNYDYQTTFSLTGFDPTTASIIGNWSSDNYGVAIYLNGVMIDAAPANPPGNDNQFFWGWVPYTITSGFTSGINTLDFVVSNMDGQAGSATALRVEMSGTANPTPEPSTLVLACLAAALAVPSLRRRRNARR